MPLRKNLIWISKNGFENWNFEAVNFIKTKKDRFKTGLFLGSGPWAFTFLWVSEWITEHHIHIIDKCM